METSKKTDNSTAYTVEFGSKQTSSTPVLRNPDKDMAIPHSLSAMADIIFYKRDKLLYIIHTRGKFVKENLSRHPLPDKKNVTNPPLTEKEPVCYTENIPAVRRKYADFVK